MLAARHVFTNKRVDYNNLKRILAEDRITYLAPGIYPEEFRFDPGVRAELRNEWQFGDHPIVFSAAMFRPDVKTEGLVWMIETCGRMLRNGKHFYLVIAGEGSQRSMLEKLAHRHLPGRVKFVGKIERSDMYRYYSAADVFAFPGIGESLGMVYLEAQSCGLPVVAFDNTGVPEVVCDQTTGFLEPMYARKPFMCALDRLISDVDLRRQMGAVAKAFVRKNHDLNKNYHKMEKVLLRVVQTNRADRSQAGLK